MTPRVMGQEEFPKERMTPERLAASQSFGLASRLQFTHPEPVTETTAAMTVAPPAPDRALALVGQPITGRETLVLQVPGGQVRYEGTDEGATAKARELAHDEAAAFVVLTPVRLCQPQTIIHEDTF